MAVSPVYISVRLNISPGFETPTIEVCIHGTSTQLPLGRALGAYAAAVG